VTDLIVRVLAIAGLPLVTLVLLRAVHRDPSVIGLKPSSAIAGQQQPIPPRLELYKRLLACNPRAVIPPTDKDLNDNVAECEKNNAKR
jgi:hypothetical protein